MNKRDLFQTVTGECVAYCQSMVRGLIILDENSNIKYANPSFCSMFGYRLSDLMEMNLPELITPGQPHPHGSNMRIDVETGESPKYGASQRTVMGLHRNRHSFQVKVTQGEKYVTGKGEFRMRAFTELINETESGTHRRLEGYSEKHLDSIVGKDLDNG